MLLLSGAAGCGAKPGAPGAAASADKKPAEARIGAAAPGAVESFPAMTVKAGSLPGSPGRDPALEADLVPVALTAFEIDRAPFPGEPGEPAVQLDYAAAAAACGRLGKRLCSELEWEHACNQASGASFASAAEWVLETTADAAVAGVRGGSEPLRCAARATLDKTSSLAFRCCRGAPQAARYPAPTASPSATLGAAPLSLSLEEMRKALNGVPSLAALAPGFTPFSTSDADAALRRGKRSRDGITAWSFLPAAITWTPAPNEELVILAGRSGAQALIAVLYALGDGTYAHAASALLNEADATVAIASSTTAPAPRELLWTTCYGCPNESGTIRYGDDRRVVIEFR